MTGNKANTTDNNEENKCQFPDIGFFKPEATVIEFVILLILGLMFYTSLHFFIPPSPPLSTKAKENKVSTLEQIANMQVEIDNQQRESTTETDTSLGANLAKQAQEWPSGLETFLEEIPVQKKVKINQILGEIANESKDLASTENTEERQKILSNIEQQLKDFDRLIQERSFFWSDNKKWLEVIFWTLFGTLLYLIQQTSEYKLKEGNKEEKNQKPGKRADDYLRRYKPQYYSYILRSPFISLTITSGDTLTPGDTLTSGELTNKNHQQVIIRAAREDDESISTIALVILAEDEASDGKA